MTGFLALHLALLEWYDGNPEAAERHRLVSAELNRDEGNHAQDLFHMWVEAVFAAGCGEFERARKLAASAIELGQETGTPLFAAPPATVLAYIDLWTGQPAAAHERLGPMRDCFVSNGFGQMGSMWLGFWSVDIEALIALGRLDEAQLVSVDLLERAYRSENPNAVAVAERCRGLLLGTRGEVAAGIDAMQMALGAHERRRLAPEVARTLLELGCLQRRAKQKRAAKQSLEEALAIFERVGAAMWVERARDELGRVGLRRSAVSEGLTPAQARVAELVAAGMSNREIASTLYMSLRSVESHLTKVYRELGVKSRAQLAATLAAKANHDEPLVPEKR
jgi:DNA-binding CsgD family transcriptional regulator